MRQRAQPVLRQAVMRAVSAIFPVCATDICQTVEKVKNGLFQPRLRYGADGKNEFFYAFAEPH